MRRLSLAALAALVTFPLLACQPLPAPGDGSTPIARKVYVFCGADVDNVNAARTVRSFASTGITATMGPCNAPSPGYTPAFTGTRYDTPTDYARLADLNGSVGLRTIVYDARVWGTEAEQVEARTFWQSRIDAGLIEAWDMGDEFDPNGPEWAILVERWAKAKQIDSRVQPYTNHLWWAIDQAVADFGPASVSFDQYDGDGGQGTAIYKNGMVARLMCAVNTLHHGPFVPSANGIRSMMRKLRTAGCDDYLIFGGAVPLMPGFGSYSLVNAGGYATTWATAVRQGLA